MRQRKRHIVQALATLAQNANLSGFVSGSIYRGAAKSVCVPGLNCYSCPGALGACPLGSLQSVAAGNRHNISFYVLGLLLLFGTVFGRLICGFLCPFGFFQELLHRIPLRKRRLPRRLDKTMRWGKYLALLAALSLPALLTDAFGLGAPVFCKYICPAGTLEGGIPLLLGDASLCETVGPLFFWKLAVLLAVVAASIVLYRPFCKYLCPLGAFYGLLNRVSLYRMKLDSDKCTNCGACERRCPMDIDVRRSINSAECIRCGACREACPSGAIGAGFVGDYIARAKNKRPAGSGE